MAKLLRGDLVYGYTKAYVGSGGLSGLARSEKRCIGAGMIARTVTIGLGLLVGKTGKNLHLVADGFNGLQRWRKLVISPLPAGGPLWHDGTVGSIDKSHAPRWGFLILGCAHTAGSQRLKPRQSQHGSHATKKIAAFDGSVLVHGFMKALIN